MKKTFNACTGGINDWIIRQKRQLGVKENVAFIATHRSSDW